MIELRELEDGDAERLFHWRREPEVDRWMYQPPPETIEGHARWFAGFRNDPDRTGWVITSAGEPSGLLIISGLSGGQKRGQWSWYIGSAAERGRGTGRAAQALGLDKAFGELGLQKVWSEVLADNDVALKSLTAAGFRREGYLRRHMLKHEVYRDVALLAILSEEWTARRTTMRRSLAASSLIAADARATVR